MTRWCRYKGSSVLSTISIVFVSHYYVFYVIFNKKSNEAFKLLPRKRLKRPIISIRVFNINVVYLDDLPLICPGLFVCIRLPAYLLMCNSPIFSIFSDSSWGNYATDGWYMGIIEIWVNGWFLLTFFFYFSFTFL